MCRTVRSASQASIARPQLDVVMLLAAMMIGIYFLTMYVALSCVRTRKARSLAEFVARGVASWAGVYPPRTHFGRSSLCGALDTDFVAFPGHAVARFKIGSRPAQPARLM